MAQSAKAEIPLFTPKKLGCEGKTFAVTPTQKSVVVGSVEKLKRLGVRTCILDVASKERGIVLQGPSYGYSLRIMSIDQKYKETGQAYVDFRNRIETETGSDSEIVSFPIWYSQPDILGSIGPIYIHNFNPNIKFGISTAKPI